MNLVPFFYFNVFAVGNSLGPVLVQGTERKCGQVKMVIEIPTLPILIAGTESSTATWACNTQLGLSNDEIEILSSGS